MVGADLKPYVYAGVLAVAFGAGWAVNGWRVGSKVSEISAAHDRSMLNAAEAAATRLKAATDERDVLQGQLTTIAQDGQKRIEAVNAENNRLSRCLRDGTCGVRIAATCPPSLVPVPSGPGGGLVAPAPGPFVSAALGQDILDLRAGIERTEETLRATQEALRALQATTPAAQP